MNFHGAQNVVASAILSAVAYDAYEYACGTKIRSPAYKQMLASCMCMVVVLNSCERLGYNAFYQSHLFSYLHFGYG